MGKSHNMRVLIAGVERVLRVLRKNGYSGVAVTQGVEVNNVQVMGVDFELWLQKGDLNKWEVMFTLNVVPMSVYEVPAVITQLLYR